MTSSTEHLARALADRYTVDRQLGAGGMATGQGAEVRDQRGRRPPTAG